jgi:putative tryptophan/tyrosine transport system substrate-binding protein
VKRREFILALGGAAAWPFAARAQQPAIPFIGLLNGQSSTHLLPAFRQGLSEAGFDEGRNIAIVYRSAEGEIERLPALAAELVGLRVAVIAAVGGDSSVLSAKAATATIPIVFTSGGDPVESGIVASLSRPGGNVTGATFLGSMAATKQIGLLRDMVPRLETIGLLVTPLNAPTAAAITASAITRDVQSAAQAAGIKAVIVEVNSERDLDTAFAQLVEQRVDALVVGSFVFFNRHRDRLVALMAQHRIPATFTNRDFPAAGGLMSYGADNRDAYRQAGIYVGRILKGDKPANLPVMQPTKFMLAINMKTVKALGLAVSPGLLAIADEVIE